MHFPWGYPHRTLSGTLPCEARTFLTARHRGPRDRLAQQIKCLIIIHMTTAFVNAFLSNAPLYREYASADELSHDRVVRDALARDALEVIKELEQPVRLNILGAVLGNTEEQRLGELL